MPIHAVTLPSGHTISDERDRMDMEFVHRSLAQTYWGADRPRAITERSFAHCLPFGVYGLAGQVGFARVLTDYATRAHLGDVFLHPAVRGAGLGVALVRVVLSHPELATVTHWTLTTRDAHGLYARFGFTATAAAPNWMTMERLSPDGAAAPAPTA